MSHTEAYCVYQYYMNNRIHRLTLRDDSRQAVDEAIQHMNNILDKHPFDRKLRLIIDARNGVPPLQHFFTQLRRMYAKRQNLPEIRAIYLYKGNVLLSILELFFNRLGVSGNRRFVHEGTELEAQEWLLSDQETED